MTQRCLTEETFPPKKVSEDASHEKMCHAGHLESLHIRPALGPLSPCYPIIGDQPTVAYRWARTVPCPNSACPATGACPEVPAKSSKGGRCGAEVPLLKTLGLNLPRTGPEG